MSKLAYAKSHRDLIVYQKTRALANEIFDLTKSFSRDETYSLTDQNRRSSRSVGAQIAEAWAKRRYEKHFISKLTDADGEQHETQHWLETAQDCEYLSQAKAQELVERCREIGRLLGSMMDKANLFCKPSSQSVREARTEYFVN